MLRRDLGILFSRLAAVTGLMRLFSEWARVTPYLISLMAPTRYTEAAMYRSYVLAEIPMTVLMLGLVWFLWFKSDRFWASARDPAESVELPAVQDLRSALVFGLGLYFLVIGILSGFPNMASYVGHSEGVNELTRPSLATVVFDFGYVVVGAALVFASTRPDLLKQLFTRDRFAEHPADAPQ